jgi:hypothetical protein
MLWNHLYADCFFTNSYLHDKGWVLHKRFLPAAMGFVDEAGSPSAITHFLGLEKQEINCLDF